MYISIRGYQVITPIRILLILCLGFKCVETCVYNNLHVMLLSIPSKQPEKESCYKLTYNRHIGNLNLI